MKNVGDERLLNLQKERQFLVSQLGEDKLRELITVLTDLSKAQEIRPYYIKEVANYWHKVSLLP
ncbi:hypothetical protein EFM42_07235 [Levilactobacillus brevis]|nr:hypothetical protein [Levilactobacillus brevis]